MAMIHQSIEVAAEPGVLFDLTQDYALRLDRDSSLKEVRAMLLVRAERPATGRQLFSRWIAPPSDPHPKLYSTIN